MMAQTPRAAAHSSAILLHLTTDGSCGQALAPHMCCLYQRMPF